MLKRIAKVYEIKDDRIYLEVSKLINGVLSATDEKDEPFLMSFDLKFFKDRPQVGDEFVYLVSIEKDAE